jgi:hypothetical protein
MWSVYHSPSRELTTMKCYVGMYVGVGIRVYVWVRRGVTCLLRELGPIVYLCRCKVSCLISVLCLHRATDEWDADVYMLQAVIHNVYDVSDGYFNHGCGKSGVAVSLQSGRLFRVSERWKQRGVGLAESTGQEFILLAAVPSGTLDFSSRTSLQGISRRSFGWYSTVTLYFPHYHCVSGSGTSRHDSRHIWDVWLSQLIPAYPRLSQTIQTIQRHDSRHIWDVWLSQLIPTYPSLSLTIPDYSGFIHGNSTFGLGVICLLSCWYGLARPSVLEGHSWLILLSGQRCHLCHPEWQSET